jgi:signal transduction histidine kinase/ActR/RegA family two-component response regulator
MTFQLILFSFDMLEFSLTLVVLGLLWFADKRTPRVRSLITVGVATCFWIIFDSIAMVAQASTYGYFYTLRSIMLVIDPFCFLWFMLSMNESPLRRRLPVKRLIFLLPAFDVLLLLSDPLHHLVFTSHGFPLPVYGPLFALHSAIAYAAVVLVIGYIFRFLAIAKPPKWLVFVAVTFSLLPVLVNVLFTLHLLEMDQDIAPTAFFALFIAFSIHAFRTRLINFKAMALTEIFEVFRDPIIFIEKDFVITDSNRAMGRYFPDFKMISGKTTLADFSAYLKGRSQSRHPEDIFDRLELDDLPEWAEFSVSGGESFDAAAPSGKGEVSAQPVTFTVNLQRIYRNNRLYGFSLTLSDVSGYHAMIGEMTRLKELAESASEAKSMFLANMSHEIRTPLNAIVGLGELEMRNALPEQTLDNLQKMNNSAQVLLSIINDLLDISKIESGRFELIPVGYFLPSLVSDIVGINMVRIGSKPIVFALNIDENIPTGLFGDELRVRQLVSNLLSNAFKYTREGRVELSIGCELDGENAGNKAAGGKAEGGKEVTLVFAVKDTGIGIKPEDLKKLFGDYYQVDTKSNRHIEGTGLGLAISKRFAGMMGGDISVESEYGKGSTFTARIRQGITNENPIGESTARALRELHFGEGGDRRKSSEPRFQLPHARLLVVDDVEINLEVAKGMMEVYGPVIDCVQSGQEAIELIRDAVAKYDAVFMDHMMPGMDGIETVRIIRDEIDTDYARTVPVIALTANAIIGNEEMFLKHGFQALLPKPIEIKKLDAVLNKWVRVTVNSEQ